MLNKLWAESAPFSTIITLLKMVTGAKICVAQIAIPVTKQCQITQLT